MLEKCFTCVREKKEKKLHSSSSDGKNVLKDLYTVHFYQINALQVNKNLEHIKLTFAQKDINRTKASRGKMCNDPYL